MSEETKQCLIVCVCTTVLLLGFLFFGGSCDTSRQKAINECVKQGQDVEACRRGMP